MDPMIEYWCLCLIKALVWFIEGLTDFVIGYSFTKGPKKVRRNGDKYEDSAQIVKVLWRAKETDIKVSRLNNFLYKHESYVHPNFVLKNKRMSLLAVEKDYALFCITNPDVNICDTSKFPFMSNWQYLKATGLLIMPIKSFHRLANEIGDPEVPVTIMAMSARCGSTLLVQACNRVPGIRAISEPKAIINIHELRKKHKVSSYESRCLIKSAIRLQCKVEAGSNVKRIFMKMHQLSGYQFQDFAELFPKFQFFFNTRHPLPTLMSYRRMQNAVTQNQSLYFKLNFHWRDAKAMQLNFPYDGRFDHFLFRFSRSNKYFNYELVIFIYSLAMDAYFQNKGIYRRVIFYENLSEEPAKELGTLFDLMGIEQKHLPLAMEAFETDSQNGIFGPRTRAGPIELDPKLLEMFDQTMKDMDMPYITHDMSVEDFKKLFYKQHDQMITIS